MRMTPLIARLRAWNPIISVLPTLMIGQILSKLLPPIVLGITFLVTTAFLLRSRVLLGSITGLALGLLTSFEVPRRSDLPMNGVFLGVVKNEGRRVKPGALNFLIKVHATKSRDGTFQSSRQPALWSCRAVELPWKNVNALRPGSVIAFAAQTRTFSPRLLPWERDARLVRRGISGECKTTHVAHLSKGRMPVGLSLRSHLVGTLLATGGDDELSYLLLSLSLGVRDRISGTTERLFAALGMTHVLVLSGMQVGLIFFLMRSVTRKTLSAFSLRFYSLRRSVELVLALLASGLLVLITDFETSAFRAWCAAALVGLFELFERPGGLWRGASASFFVLCIVWPGSWAEPGVQLSFAALLGLAFGSHMARGRFEAYLLPCIFASLFTFAVQAAWFHTLPWLSPLSNLLFAPLLGGVICVLGLLAIVWNALSLPCAEEAVFFVKWLLSLLLEVLQGISVSKLEESGLGVVFVSILCVSVLLAFVLVRSARRLVREYSLVRP